MSVSERLIPGMELWLEQQGVLKNSVWSYLRNPDDDPPTALLIIKSVIRDELKITVYPLESGPWGNKTPETRKLENLEADEFMRMYSTGHLRLVSTEH